MVTDDSASHHFGNAATCAVSDLLGHFWKGDHLSGEIVSTWNGYTDNLPDPRGSLWERGTFTFALDALARATGDQHLRDRISADWARTRGAFTTNELEACGSGSDNPACDDAGWAALMYLAAYRASGDQHALARTRGIVNNALMRWADDELGGGMWYSDKRDIKSLYQQLSP